MLKQKTEAENMQLRTCNSQELSDMYEVSKKTFLKWLKPFKNDIGERNGNFYSVNQVAVIFQKLGLPGKLFIE